MNPEAHESVARAKGRPPLRDLRQFALAVPAACWLLGAILFLRADGSMTWRLPRLVEARGSAREQNSDGPTSERNLASFRFGPTVRASSYYRDVYAQHHPAFALDERAFPSLLEKWSSGLRDERPWLEVLWHQPHALRRVVIRHAGSVEANELTIRRYRLRCISQGSERIELEVRDNRAVVAEHALPCAQATGVRIDWQPNRRDGLVRVYELEAWGR